MPIIFIKKCIESFLVVDMSAQLLRYMTNFGSVGMAEWLRGETTEPGVLGSNPPQVSDCPNSHNVPQRPFPALGAIFSTIYISVNKPNPWAVAGPHGQLASPL